MPGGLSPPVRRVGFHVEKKNCLKIRKNSRDPRKEK